MGAKLKKVLILGGGGFIGINVAKALLERGTYDITIIDNFSRGNEQLIQLSPYESSARYKVISADLTCPEGFSALDNEYDYVYMLAAMVGVDKVNALPHEVIRVNSLLVVNCLEWLRGAACRRVIFSSTSETYAGTVDAFGAEVPTAETVPLTIENIRHPRFTYAVTKMLGESGFINYANQGFFDATVVRYHNVYGPMMGFRHVIPHLAERFVNGEAPFKIYGHDQTRSFNYIDDAVAGTILAAEKGLSGEIYHIGDSTEISIETLTRFVGDIFDYCGPYEFADTFPGSVSRRSPDISKAISELGYQPKTSWQDGVRTTIDWYQVYLTDNNSNAESFYDQYGIR